MGPWVMDARFVYWSRVNTMEVWVVGHGLGLQSGQVFNVRGRGRVEEKFVGCVCRVSVYVYSKCI
jgi:hypothetical protein